MKRFLLLFSIFTYFNCFAQPSNDDCDFATILIPSGDLSCTGSVHGTVLNATASVQANSCAYTADDDDVWYRFTATSPTHRVSLTNVIGSSIDLYFVVYENPCATLGTQILCSDNNSSNVVDLTIGQDYFIRVYTKTSAANQTSEFDICVTSPPIIPLNNECTNALSVNVGSNGDCSSELEGTINGATNSTQANTCSTTLNNDVWYSFVATMSAEVITITPLNESPMDYYHAVYASNCGALASPLKCSDLNQSTVTGLVVGNTYLVRVFSVDPVPEGIVSDFSICVSEPLLPPSNDECINAINLTVNEDFLCSSFENGNVINALQSNQPYICSNSTYVFPNDDVWYKFTATRTIHTLQFFNLGGSSPNITYTVSTGNCSSLNSPILCGSSIADESNLLSNLVIGTTYYVRVFSSTNTLNQTTSFSICVGSQPRPVNDECSGAIQIPVVTTNSCGGLSASILYATLSPDVSSCSTTDQADVWYKFIASDVRHVINLSGQYTNSADAYKYDVYDGNCANLGSNILCNARYANQLNNLTVGNEYLVKLHGAASGTLLSVNFCIKTVEPRPINDECTGAILIDVNQDLVCDTVFNGSIFNASPSMLPANNAMQDDDVWLKFYAKSTSQIITINNPLNSNQYYDVRLYNDCNASSELAMSIFQPSFLAQNLTVNSLYYLRISSTQSNAVISDSFQICIKSAEVPANDECSNAIPIGVSDTYLCENSLQGTIDKSTASNENNSCGENFDNDDVWYEFTALNSKQVVSITRLSGSNIAMKFTLYEGSDCASMTEIACYNSYSILSNLTIGNKYYLRVYTDGSLPNLTTVFNICVANPPINDECANASVLTVNPTLTCAVDSLGSLNFATSSGVNSCSNSSPEDVWYQFTATNITHWVTFPSASGIAYSVYGSDCNSFASPLFCHSGNAGSNFRGVVTNLVAGQNYYVRVYKNASSGTGSTFRICISTPDIAPPNDECVNAIDLPVNNSILCENTLACSIPSGVTPSIQTIPSCAVNNSTDVWYKFTAIGQNMELNILNSEGDLFYMYFAIYSGVCGNLGTELNCDYYGRKVLTNLTIGQTYYVRTFPFVSVSYPTSEYNLCVKLLDVPVNDECANATYVPVNNSINCDSIVHGTFHNATNSSNGSFCSSSTLSNDVWYTFTATTTKHTIYFSNLSNNGQTLSPSNFRFNVYSGICSNLGAAIYCPTLGGSYTYGSLQNLIIGNTYTIRVFNTNSTTNQSLEFDLCIRIPTPPVNDECENATLLVTEVDNSCTLSSSGTLFNATPSFQNNSCSNASDDDDVWYKFVATTENQAVNILNVLNNTDLFHSIYSGNCPNLSNILCSDENSSVSSNLIVDSTYYVRIYSTSILAQNTTFKVCSGPFLSIPACLNNLPAGNDCQNALSMCDFNGYCGRTRGTYTTESWLELDTTFCGTLENNSFLAFTPDSDSIALNVWVTSTVTNLGIQIFIFDAENCQGPVENRSCWDPNYVPPGHKLITASGLIPGHKYYMMIDGQSGDICDYVFGSTSNISSPIEIVASQDNFCLGDSVILTASGGDGSFLWPNSPEFNMLSNNTVSYTPTNLGLNTFNISSFENNSNCGPNSEISFEISTRSCICPVVVSNNSDSCVNNSFDLFASEIFGASYEWSGPNNFQSSLQNPIDILPVLSEGEFTYTVVVTTPNETCTAETVVSLNPISDPSFAYSDSIFCTSSSLILPSSITQSGGLFSSADLQVDVNTGEINLQNLVLGIYQISYVTSGFCSQSTSKEIEIVAIPSIQTVIDQEICIGESFQEILFNTTNATNFEWTNSNSQIGLAQAGIDNISAFTPTLGDVQATIEVTPIGNACSGNPISFNLIVNSIPSVSMPSFNPICSSAQNFILSGGLPAGGFYSGANVNGTTFDVLNAGVGSHLVTYTFIDPLSGCSNSDSIFIQINDCSGLNDIYKSDGLTVQPNPSQGLVTIELNGNFEFELQDLNGKVLIKSTGKNQKEIDLSKLADGIYILKILQNTKYYTKELVLKK